MAEVRFNLARGLGHPGKPESAVTAAFPDLPARLREDMGCSSANS